MKKLIIFSLLLIVSSATFAQLGYPYTKSQTDALFYKKTVADTTFSKVDDIFTPTTFDTVQVTNKATAPTMPTTTNTTDVATTAFVQGELAANQYVFTINVDGGAISSPVDATTYYAGSLLGATPIPSAGNRRIYLQKDCTFTGYSCNIFCYTGGTSETYTIYIRKNGTTDYALGTTFESATTATAKYFQANNLNVSFAAGDWFEIKIVTPTWATNPASLIHSFILYFKTGKL